MASTLIKNALIVNEGQVQESDLRITDKRIEKIGSSITATNTDHVIEANGHWLIPGMIDDQVHFREPGLTQKGSIATESRAAVAGGITSFMEMPNVNPSTTTMSAINHKREIAAKHSSANYAFYLGATEENLEDIKSLDPKIVCGVKVFMGASTGNLLVENTNALESIFSECPVLIATHCESGPVIAKNREKLNKPDLEVTIHDHPVIRDDEACYASSSYAVDLAKRFGSQLHVLHITTEKELSLFEPGNIQGKSITAEACVHHLWFSQDDYQQQGNFIKCNPAIKSEQDRKALLAAVNSNRIDIIATDHAPHTLEEKQQPYVKAPAGLPLVQHALPTLIDHVNNKVFSIEQVVEKVCHNPAIRYQVAERGFIREGYFADLVLVNPNQKTFVSHENSLYKCGWTPFNGVEFTSEISATWVNGELVFKDGEVANKPSIGMQLDFDRA